MVGAFVMIGVAFAGDPEVAPVIGAAPPASPVATLWAGQQVTDAVRRVPILGDIRSRTIGNTLAQVIVDGDSVLIVDRPCSLVVDSDNGVALEFDPAAVRNMPAISSRFDPTVGGYAAGPWIGGWGEQDVDGDGTRGIHVRVRAPVCGGSLDIASRTSSVASGSGSPTTGLSGRIAVLISRDIVGASNPCLGLLDKHTEEQVQGTFAWVPVPAGTTCASLEAAPWPATAPDPASVVDLVGP